MAKRPMTNPESRAPLSRERVLRAAIALADEEGLDSLTMRELGLRLGVEAMSLYNHVTNKDDILDGMVDLVVGEIALPPGSAGWKQSMRQRAISARAAFALHPWASALIDSRQSSGPARLHYLDWVVGTLRRAGFPLEMTARAFSLVDSYIYGFGRQQLNMADSGDLTLSADHSRRRVPLPQGDGGRPRHGSRLRRDRRLRVRAGPHSGRLGEPAEEGVPVKATITDLETP
jgi:AcrR family transcriptional regulator